ncbi:MAG: hypothetical protein JSW61_03050 [Candidatus Thorarchaeota archaeon]|nr:MAG: hypothetical protein JSW61_03050 [Candidatus Thorarchaeota archaeon]
MSSKKRKKKPEVVQASLDTMLNSGDKKKTKKAIATPKVKKSAAKKPETSKKTAPKKAAPKKKPAAKKKTPEKDKPEPKKAAPKKKPAAKKKTPEKDKPEPKKEVAPEEEPTKKKPAAKKKPELKKKAPKKKLAKKTLAPETTDAVKRVVKEVPVEPDLDVSLRDLPSVGPKLEEKLKKAGYVSVWKLSKARYASVAKKVDGVSQDGAKNLVTAAKRLVKSKEKPEHAPEDEAEAPPSHAFALADVPGVGSKLAIKLESSGYDTVARLSRADPRRVSSAVGGLSIDRASEVVYAAKDLIQRRQLESIIGESAPEVVSEKKAPPPEEKPAEAKPKPTKAKKPKKKVEVVKPEVEPMPAPEEEIPARRVGRKRLKIKRGRSGLPVPESVKKVTKEMKKKWKEAEKKAAIPDPEAPIQDTVEVVALTADETSEKLVEIAMEILHETMMSGRPVFEIPSRSADNIVWDEIRDLLLLGMRTISRPYHSLASVVDATRTARVMEIVYKLLKSNLHATKREVFYSDVNLFRDQKYSDKIIEDLASMIQTTRDSIHVVASARGSAMGRVVIQDGGDRIDLTRMGTGGWAITPFLDQVEILESDAEYIILSEKDAAVMRLAEAKFWNRQPCIVLTGKGSGDIATRAFLKTLVKELEIPAFALVDSDPYGHYIYSVFLRGSKRLSYESPFIATPELKLLGVLSRDLDEYNIPKAVRIPMTPTDTKRVKDMLKEPFVQVNKEWVKDLGLMLKLKEKAEIQSFAAHSFEYLTDEYLPTKLETADWI